MASSVFVIDSSFRRTQVKVTPGKTLKEILDEACRSRKLSAEEYSLKTQNNKALDLSQPFRLSGLSAGAKLQLVQASRSPSVVSIALQLPENEGSARLSDKFASNTSLWLVLRKFEEGVAGQSSKKLNITQQGVPSSASGAGRLLYRQPCVNSMGRNLETFEDLQKTLAQLGYSGGSVLMRLTFRDTAQPLEDAMARISQYFDSSTLEESAPSAGAIPLSTNDAAAPVPGAAPTSQEQSSIVEVSGGAEGSQTFQDDVLMQDAINSATTASDTKSDGISVFLPPATTTPAAALHQEHESVYEPTVDDARLHQASLQRAGRNNRLLSDKELEEQESERQARLAIVKEVDVRVRYPDQSMIETTVNAHETAAQLYSKVRESLKYPTEPFELRFVGVKGHQTLPDDETKCLVKDFAFRGKVLVTCVWQPNASSVARTNSSLKEELRAKARELKVDLSQQADIQSEAGTTFSKVQETYADQKPKSKIDVEAKMKKFLGFGKK